MILYTFLAFTVLIMAVLQWNMKGFCTYKPDSGLLVRDYSNPICICLQETELKLGHNASLRIILLSVLIIYMVVNPAILLYLYGRVLLLNRQNFHQI